jgi:hypothetical protein
MREHLLGLMEHRCTECGATESERWIFHHPNNKVWESARVNSWQRIRLYMRDYNNGNLALMCLDCHNGYHNKKGAA